VVVFQWKVQDYGDILSEPVQALIELEEDAPGSEASMGR
jgi:hypothetical protein